MAGLLAGLPIEVPGQTINRLCGSGLQAVASAAQAVRAGEGDLFVAGGVESMTRAPYVMLKSGKSWDRTPPSVADSTVGWRFTNPRLPNEWTISLGQTAERVAALYGIGRAEQDTFAVESQRRAQEALASGVFADEIFGIEVNCGAKPATVTFDEPPRAGVTLEALAKLPPAFTRDGTAPRAARAGSTTGRPRSPLRAEVSSRSFGSLRWPASSRRPWPVWIRAAWDSAPFPPPERRSLGPGST
jgi:acetyl-CoA acetyltransferase